MPVQVQSLLRSCFLLTIEVGCLTVFIVFTCLSYRKLAQTWKRGLLFAILATLLALPGAILTIMHLDVKTLAGSSGMPPEMMLTFAIIGALIAVVIQFVCRPLYYHVAAVEWARFRGAPRPAVSPNPTPWFGIGIGAAIGAAAAILTMFLFAWWGVGESQAIKSWQRIVPGLLNVPAILLVPALLGTVVSAALVEEMIFRGGLLGLLLRATSSRRGYAWLWIVVTTIPWALLHWENTDRPLFKMSQIFLLGLIFGYLALRWGLFSSMAAHISLNVVVVALAFLAPAVFAAHPHPGKRAAQPPSLAPAPRSSSSAAAPALFRISQSKTVTIKHV